LLFNNFYQFIKFKKIIKYLYYLISLFIYFHIQCRAKSRAKRGNVVFLSATRSIPIKLLSLQQLCCCLSLSLSLSQHLHLSLLAICRRPRSLQKTPFPLSFASAPRVLGRAIRVSTRRANAESFLVVGSSFNRVRFVSASHAIYSSLLLLCTLSVSPSFRRDRWFSCSLLMSSHMVICDCQIKIVFTIVVAVARRTPGMLLRPAHSTTVVLAP
jgi:hypothetical protein